MSKEEASYLAEEIIRVKKRERWYARWRNSALVLFVVVLAFMFSPKKEEPKSHIAMINIEGVISSESYFWDQFAKISSDTKAVLLLVNSPGGTIGDSERLYNEVRALQETMPVALLVENMAASGGYLAALASDKIYAYNGATIGSIGVVLSYWDAKELWDKIGVREERLTTGKYKGYPSTYAKMPLDVKQHFQNILESNNEWFVDLAVERRDLDRSEYLAIKEAQVYSAQDALRLRLIDGISTRQEQLASLREQVGPLELKDLEHDEDDFMTALSKALPQRRMLSSLLSHVGGWHLI